VSSWDTSNMLPWSPRNSLSLGHHQFLLWTTFKAIYFSVKKYYKKFKISVEYHYVT